MAKTYGDLLPQIYDFAALERAYRRARAGKRTRPEVMRFERDLEGELIALQNELIWGEYRTGAYRRFVVQEPKMRLVAALPFRDRVVQHSLVAAIEPVWEARFIADSYACRPGRGMHRGADRAQEMLRQVQRAHGRVYVLKGDVAAYFASIDHGVLSRLLRQRMTCHGTLALCDEILGSTVQPGALAPRGLPIGNLTSQLWANIYLHELDLLAKHRLGCRRYIRYMDDFVVFHYDKDWLHEVRAQIEAFLWEQLRLRTNAKTQVFPVALGGQGLDFLGYRMWPTHRRLRRSSIRRMARSLKRLRRLYAEGEISRERVQQTIDSWLAHARHADAVGLRRSLLRPTRGWFCKRDAANAQAKTTGAALSQLADVSDRLLAKWGRDSGVVGATGELAQRDSAAVVAADLSMLRNR